MRSIVLKIFACVRKAIQEKQLHAVEKEKSTEYYFSVVGYFSQGKLKRWTTRNEAVSSITLTDDEFFNFRTQFILF